MKPINIWYAYHGPENDANFDFSNGYGFSRNNKRANVSIGDQVYIIQKLRLDNNFYLCGLFEIIGHYQDDNFEKKFRLELKNLYDKSSFKILNVESLSRVLPPREGNEKWNNFQKHFCAQGSSFRAPISPLISNILRNCLTDELDNQVINSFQLSKEDRSIESAKWPKIPKSTTIVVSRFIRNPHVVAEKLLEANGICQACEKAAPFYKKIDGSPYLEIHHKKPLSDGGEDTLENTIAICPNCHRKFHFGSLKD